MTPNEYIGMRYGFKWGPVTVERTAVIRGQLALTIKTDAGQCITVMISPNGHQIRVFHRDDDTTMVRPT